MRRPAVLAVGVGHQVAGDGVQLSSSDIEMVRCNYICLTGNGPNGYGLLPEKAEIPCPFFWQQLMSNKLSTPTAMEL
jgi:hypothetical protein